MAKRTVKVIEDEMRAESLVTPSEENGWRSVDDARLMALEEERDALLPKQA